ncbi:hypothetical protein tinsulaeT_17530 [Thalassotalea insulae]|uniref:DUF523 domain-containing protein n=1 Tax=Thalassotalea insulae TaxID=2056778 RepID=A0ABQ6GR21_9GAMM|nr:DUF523 domain-containing protein [Thalassotalea insulae]GLX78413.1 hypothetical protein tinsulaeT_17530 [Thalassotalea insulae]
MEKILVSACLLGQSVRYDGGHQLLLNQQLIRWQQQGRVVAVCPEVAGGLSVPRAPAEISQLDHRVYDNTGIDVTDAFNQGAQSALALCQRHKIRYALLKESSPSCGSQLIYDGHFQGEKIVGQGLTAALLRQNGITVYSEQSLNELIVQVEALDQDN